jgi:2-oxoglutarate ferredoxin oxidoreductase subunit alpha
MTTTSSPGYSLMQETVSYLAMSFVPCVIVNIMRGGPGLGNIQPAQGDYFQMTKGGGHGDYNLIVLAPATVQETVDLIIEAFDLADKYLQPVTVIADGMIGQIMEPVDFPEIKEPERPERPWALTGAKGRKKNVITSLFLGAQNLEAENIRLQEIIAEIKASEVRYDEYMMDGAEIVVVAYGTAGRIVQTAVKQARAEGIPVGLFRPISMFPFPYDRLDEIADTARHILVVELSAGQMIEDVRLATHCRIPISFFGKMGGIVPLPDDVLVEIKKLTTDG